MQFCATVRPCGGRTVRCGCARVGCSGCGASGALCALARTGRAMTNETILNVEALSKEFVLPRRSPFAAYETVKAVDGVSFAVTSGEVLGLVGESGSDR